MRLIRRQEGVQRAGLPALAVLAPLLVCLNLVLASAAVRAQAPAANPPKTAPAKVPALAAKSDWSELTPAQQAALQPLAPTWGGISTAQRRKWIALSRNYPSLSTAERATLHGRMTEWAALSPAQRNQARLNFARTKRLSTEEKKAQWQAYQALSPEQKKQFAAGARAPAAGAAPALTPLAPNKLAAVPVTRSEASAQVHAAPKPRSRRAAAAPRGAASAAPQALQP